MRKVHVTMKLSNKFLQNVLIDIHTNILYIFCMA